MQLNYHYAESTIKQPELEVNGNTVYLRKDFEEITRESETTGKITYWTYQEATLTRAEFSQYLNMVTAMNALKGQNDSVNISSLVAGQSTSEFYQVAIMEALADLYETLLINGS